MSSGYTKEDCFNAISFVAEEVDEPITVNDYRRNTNENHPSTQSIKDIFNGSISRAIYRAGYNPTRYTNPTYRECKEAFQRVVTETGSIPRRTDYENCNETITANVIKQTINADEWSDVIEEFGYDPAEVYGIERGSQREKEAYIEALETFVETNNIENQLNFEEARDYFVNETELGRDGYFRHWESWGDFIEEVGFESNHVSSFSEGELYQFVRETAEEIGRTPTCSEVTEYHNISRSGFKRLGSWEEIVEHLGMDIREARAKCGREEFCKTASRIFEEFEEEHGRRPMKHEFDEFRSDDDPSSDMAFTFFDSFTELVKELGYQPTKVHNITREKCVKAIEEVIKELGRVPTTDEYKTYRKNGNMHLPSRPSINRHSEGFTQIIDSLGYTPQKVFSFTREDAIEGINEVAARLPHSAPPTFKEYGSIYRNIDNMKKYPSNVFVVREFDGKWNDALRAAGYSDDELNYDPETANGEYGAGHYYGPNWYSRKNKVREYDEECQMCNLTNEKHLEKYDCSLHVHHLIPFRVFKPVNNYEKPNAWENLVSLCYECHHKLESLIRTHEYSKQLEYLPNDKRWSVKKLNKINPETDTEQPQNYFSPPRETQNK